MYSRSKMQDHFMKYGKCRFRYKTNFAFVEFINKEDAEDAMEALNGKEFAGRRIGVEFTK
jgi:RNA recognition motif-containing protein